MASFTNEQTATPAVTDFRARSSDRVPTDETGVMRVVSLVPSVTETLLDWGVTPIACTRFCEQPSLPTVGGTKNPDLDAIIRLAPDLVVMDEEENNREDHDALVAAGVNVHVLDVCSLDDLATQLPALAHAVEANPSTMPSWPDAADAPSTQLRTACVMIWRRPWMTLGPDTYGAALLARLGITVIPDDHGRYPTVELDDVAALQPDLILAPSEPYRFKDAHLRELEPIAPTFPVDGQDLFWWGTRTPAALDRLASHLARAEPPSHESS